ncbi:MAG: DUF550 domain-containing protein [Candidatus Omnitrophica bacterium]|nr:DUF550 domain-containing protein [Candidatus Omnitrophota bacterium]
MINLNSYLYKQQKWSEKTFGPGNNTEGLCKHIEKELEEIKQAPHDPMEYADVMILLLDMMWRNNVKVDDFVRALADKQEINLKRKWHLENMGTGKPIEHVRD